MNKRQLFVLFCTSNMMSTYTPNKIINAPITCSKKRFKESNTFQRRNKIMGVRRGGDEVQKKSFKGKLIKEIREMLTKIYLCSPKIPHHTITFLMVRALSSRHYSLLDSLLVILPSAAWLMLGSAKCKLQRRFEENFREIQFALRRSFSKTSNFAYGAKFISSSFVTLNASEIIKQELIRIQSWVVLNTTCI